MSGRCGRGSGVGEGWGRVAWGRVGWQTDKRMRKNCHAKSLKHQHRAFHGPDNPTFLNLLFRPGRCSKLSLQLTAVTAMESESLHGHVVMSLPKKTQHVTSFKMCNLPPDTRTHILVFSSFPFIPLHLLGKKMWHPHTPHQYGRTDKTL